MLLFFGGNRDAARIFARESDVPSFYLHDYDRSIVKEDVVSFEFAVSPVMG